MSIPIPLPVIECRFLNVSSSKLHNQIGPFQTFSKMCFKMYRTKPFCITPWNYDQAMRRSPCRNSMLFALLVACLSQVPPYMSAMPLVGWVVASVWIFILYFDKGLALTLSQRRAVSRVLTFAQVGVYIPDAGKKPGFNAPQIQQHVCRVTILSLSSVSGTPPTQAVLGTTNRAGARRASKLPLQPVYWA